MNPHICIVGKGPLTETVIAEALARGCTYQVLDSDPGSDAIHLDSSDRRYLNLPSTSDSQIFNIPLIYPEPCLKAEWEQGPPTPPAPMQGYKNLSPSRVADRRRKNKTARKSRRRNR